MCHTETSISMMECFGCITHTKNGKNSSLFWCNRTIRATFTKLEKKNLIVSGNYNKFGYDRTKWYTINYNAIESLKNQEWVNSATSNRKDMPTAMGSYCPTNTIDYNTKNTTKTSSYRVRFSDEKTHAPSFEDIDYDILHRQIQKACTKLNKEKDYDGLVEIFDYFYEAYKHFMSKPHVKMKDENIEKAIIGLTDDAPDWFYPELDICQQLILRYFNTEFIGNEYGDCNYSIIHFTTTLEIGGFGTERYEYGNYVPFE